MQRETLTDKNNLKQTGRRVFLNLSKNGVVSKQGDIGERMTKTLDLILNQNQEE